MSVTEQEVKRIAKLAKLKLNENEVEKFTKDLNSILEYMKLLNELDTSEVEPLHHPVESETIFREDELKSKFSRELALKNAPKTDGEFFLVPKVIRNKAK